MKSLQITNPGKAVKEFEKGYIYITESLCCTLETNSIVNHLCSNIKIKNFKNAGEGVQKRELSSTTGGNVNWYSHNGEHYGDSLQNEK